METSDNHRLIRPAENAKHSQLSAKLARSPHARRWLNVCVMSAALSLGGIHHGQAQTAPTLTPNGGTFTTQQNVFVSTTNSTGTVFYTVNGAAPTTNSLPVLSNSTILISQPTTLKVAAFVGTNSAVTTASFNITGQVGTGVASSVVLRADGTVWTAGDNSVGELGTGNFTSVTTPVQALGLTGCVAVSSGYYHVLALKGDGTVWSWGNNGNGQLGTGNDGINYSIPAQVTGLSGIVAVAGGGYHSLALKNDGSVWSWGYNGAGELGDWTTTERAMPVQVQGLPTNIVAVAAGAFHSLALDGGGNLYGWGDNNDGELGLGHNVSMLNPQYITNGVAAIGAGQFHSLYVRTNGTVWATGANNLGQLGNNTTNTTLTPVQVSGLTNAASVAAGYNFSAALASNGVVWSWGDNSSKNLGVTNTFSFSAVPVQVTLVTGIAGLASQGSHSVVVLTNGTVRGWGDNASGQLALGTTSASVTPSVSQFLAVQTNQAPPVPANVLVNYNGAGTATITWVQGGSLTQSFTIQQSTNNGTSWATIGTVGGDTTSYVATGITGTTNSFRVIANGTYSSSTNSTAATALVSLAISGTNVAPANLVLTSTVSATLGTPSSVRFYEGGELLTTLTNTPYSVLVPSVTAGPHPYTAIAYASNGAAVGQGSAGITVTVPPLDLYNYWNLRVFGSNQPANYIVSSDQLRGVQMPLTDTGITNPLSSLIWPMRLALPTTYAFTQIGTTTNYRTAVINPMAAYGEASGGTPMYTGQTYSFAFYGGGQLNATTNFTVYTNPALNSYNASDFQILVYNKNQFVGGATNVTPVYTNYFSLPHQGTTNWAAFASNGYVMSNTLATNGYSLNTTIQYNIGGGNQSYSGNDNPAGTPFLISHSSTNSQYCYVINYLGVGYNTNTQYPLTVTNTNAVSNSATYVYGYALDFSARPAWVSTSLSLPAFQGQPLPSAYMGRSIDELLSISTPVTYQFAASNATSTNFTALDGSPELRTNAILDKFVSDMGSNPITLANYILNQIRLCDAISYNMAGAVSDTSINEGGVNRSALATFLEKQGNPAEQCALLVYFLRKCGVPSGYVFPNQNGLQMLDARMSSLLRLQLGQVLANTNSAPQILPVNYPWVAAYVGGQWIHIFPWLKDTAITEGYDLRGLLPAGYQTSQQWVQHYLTNDPSIMNLDTNDDSLRGLYPQWINQQLSSQGLTTNDVGVTTVDRPHNYYSWSDFPQPWGLASNGLAATNLISNLSAITNIFNTMTVTVFSDQSNNGIQYTNEPSLKTGTLRLVDLHNRQLLISTASSTNNTNVLSLSMEALRSGATNTEAFPTNGTMINPQLVSTNLTSKDTNLQVVVSYSRNRKQTATNFSNAFLGVFDTQTVTPPARPLRKGDSAVLCLDYGMVTDDMLQATAQKFWNAQQGSTMNTTTAVGTQLQLLGMTYYKRCSDLREIIEPLNKAGVVSYFGIGLSKLQPQLTSSNSLPSNGVVSLRYPAVDMFVMDVAGVGNQTVDPGSGVSQPQNFNDLFILETVGGSAEEHMALNQFYGVSDSASTVHLLHDALSQGKGILTLTSDNFKNAATNKYVFNGVTNTLQGWSGSMWASITNVLTPYATNATNGLYTAPYNIAYVTPGPILCASNTYAGVGAMIINSGSAVSALISSSSLTNPPINGGFATMTRSEVSPFNVQNYYSLQWGNSTGFTISTTLPAPTLSPFTFNGNAQINQLSSQITQLSATPSSTSFASVADAGLTLSYQFYSGNSSAGSSGSFASTVQQSMANTGWMGSVTTWMGNMFSTVGKGIIDPVDIVRGSFYVNDADLVIPGPMPITFSRNYDSQNLANNELGFGWKMGYFAYLATNALTNTSVIYAAEMDGSVIAYSPVSGSTNTWVPMASNNPTLCNQKGDSVGSVFNPFNNKITLTGAGTNAVYTLTGSDGSVRIFNVASYPVGTNTGTNAITRTRPYLTSWQDSKGNTLTFSFGSNTNSTDYGFLNRITACNGNFLQLNYDTYGHIISANAADGRLLTYSYDSYGDLVSVTRPDNSTLSYSYKHANGTGTNTALYSTHLLTQETKPGGRLLVNTYDASGRVTQQQATVGASGALTVNATLSYNTTTNADCTLSGTNTVTDAYSHTTTYTIAGGQITKVTDPLGQSVTTTWYAAGATNSGAYQRSLASRTDKRGLATSYKYDASGNLTNTSVTGNITGSGSSTAVTATTYNSLNLPTQITEPTGNSTQFTYGNSTYPYLATSVKKFASGGGLISQTDTSYTSVGTVGTIPFARGLIQSVTQGGATTSYTYNANGYPATETHPTGTQDPTVSYTLAYNLRGQLVSKTDSAGQATAYAYDDLGNRIWEERSDANGNLVDWNYNYYNANGEIEWTQGARYNPVDYTQTRYDQAGRIKEKLVWTAAASTSGGVTSGGVATTTYTHDLFGNLTQILDPMGNKTVMTYDAIGQMLSRVRTGASGGSNSESFTYEPGGKVATYVNPLGGTTTTSYTDTGLPRTQSNPDGTTQSWTYLLDGRVASETLPSGATRTTTYDDGNHKVTVSNPLYSEVQTFDARGNLLSKTDGEGYTRTTTYDSLNRPTQETGPAGATGTAQQSVSHSYDAAGLSRTDINALGETTVTSFDAIGRPTSILIYGASGGAARQTSYTYSSDHQSVAVTQGAQSSGFSAGTTTTYSDFSGRPIVVIKPDGGTSYSTYDFNGNLTGTADELGRVTTYSYNGLNYLISQTLPDGATTSYGRDAAGNMTSRAMPGGLTWSATYDTASRKTSEQLTQSGSTTRSHTYTYSSGGSGAGQLATKTDPRGIVTTYSYDSLGRRIQEAASDPTFGVTRSYTLDNRGLLKQVDQSYQNSALSPSSSVVRTLDPYGAIASEQVYVGGALKDSWTQSHNAAGRRNLLTEQNNPSLPYTFKFDAVGHVVETDFATAGYYFVYGGDGLLYYRQGPYKVQNISRDGVGRVIYSGQSMAGTTYLTENPRWNADSTQASNSITRNGSVSASDTRSYGYNLRGELLLQNFSPSSGLNGSATYQFDGGAAGGLGLRTGVTLGTAMTGATAESYGTFARLGSMTVSGSLTNNSVGTPVSQAYDAAGNVTTRTAGGSTDTLVWDAFGELMSDTRTGTGAFTWSAVYDGLGRRLQTTQGSLTVQSSYDPEIEFLELVTTINGVRNWHVTGPDLDGRYGGLNGCGGVEAIYNQSTSSAIYLLSDTYGHTEGTFNGTTFTWNPTQCDGYGALPGTTKPSALIAGDNVATQLGWRGHYIDPTGFYYMGARNYAPDSGTFLSPDPLGHSASMDLYSYCDGDPVNQYDADGRLQTGFNSGLNGNISANAPTSSAFYAGNLIGGYLSGAGSGIANAPLVTQSEQFGGNINSLYHSDGLVTASSYALTSWNVGAIASGALNVNLVNGQPVGDWEARTQTILQGVSGTAGVVSAGVGLYSSLSSGAVSATEGTALRNPNVYEALYEAPITGTSRDAQRASANNFLANQLQNDAQLNGMLNQELGGNVLQHMESGSGRSFLNPPGTVWHHPFDDPSVMQLLRTGEHTAPSLQPVLHPGGVGGFGNFYAP